MNKDEALIGSKKFADWLKARPVIFWLLLATILYIIWQISLAGAILSASSMQASDRLSTLAQKTVGFGMALFVFRTLYNKLRWLAAIPLALAAGFLAMWLEDYTVDYFAEKTGAEARMDAKKIQLFSAAMLDDKVILSDLDPAIKENKVKLRAFAKILGLAIWNTPQLIGQLNASLGPILNALYGQEAYQKIDAGYHRYVEALKSSQTKLAQLNDALLKINYAQYARDLNSQLGKYAACITPECRQKISQRVNKYLQQELPQLELLIDLEDFCTIRKQGGRYVLGRSEGMREEKVCATDEMRLHAWLAAKIDGKIKSTAGLDDLPPEARGKILTGELLSLDAWRAMWQKDIDAGISKRKTEEFANPERFAADGAQAKEGKAYAVSIFLPPVALGFSISVCFLHLASLGAAFTRKPALCGGIAFAIWLAPALFATSVPLQGFAGIYGRWLVFWEGWLYPFGLLRWLMP